MPGSTLANVGHFNGFTEGVRMTSKWWAPLSGLVFLVLLIGGGFYGGEPPPERLGIKSAQKLADAFVAQADKLSVAIFVMALGLVFFVIFASVLKTALDGGTAETDCVSRVAFAGAIIFTVGVATDLTLAVALIDAAKDKVDPVVIQTLSAYWQNDFIPIAIGVVLLVGASAVSILKYGGLPAWLGWFAALITAVALIPKIGFFALPGTGLWVLAASIVMALQARKAAPEVAL
jgi:hypothetical protein